MKEHLHSFVSNVLLYYIFDAHTLVSEELTQLKVYHRSIDDYMRWAEARVEQLFYEFDEEDEPAPSDILRLDKKLVGIFPFMERVVDRTGLISDTLNFFKKMREEVAHLSPEVLSEARPVPEARPVEGIYPPTISPSPVERAPSPVERAPSPVERASSHTPPNFVPVTHVISLDQSVHKLRKAASEIGVKNAFLLTKVDATRLLAKYNRGQLTFSDLLNCK